MTEPVITLLKQYDEFLATFDVQPVKVTDRAPGAARALGHLRWMIAEMLVRAPKDGWSDRKVNRWLGFCQGTMWAMGYKGIVGLRDDSRHLYDDK
jgi:hypothetical protein